MADNEMPDQPDPQAILRFLRDPNLQTGPYPQWPVMPSMQPGAQLRNPAPRPGDAMAPVAEALSPTMGGYGMGQIAADTALKAQQGDYAGVAANAPFIVGALKGPVRIPNPIKAFHGSPHDFNEFDLSKIGTGEGAQAYGHGLYFAEKEGVAKSYRDQLAAKANYPTNSPENAAAEALAWTGGNKDEAIRALRVGVLNQSTGWSPELYRSAADLLEGGFEPPKGKMYEVALHATPESFLDWDKPLSGQSPTVLKALGLRDPNAMGEASRHAAELEKIHGKFSSDAEIDRAINLEDTLAAIDPKGYAQFKQRLTDPEERQGFAAGLSEAGIPGVRYLDQQSRGMRVGPSTPANDIARQWVQQAGGDKNKAIAMAEQFHRETGQDPAKSDVINALKNWQGPTHNYSVWSPEIIEILRKYGIIAAPTAGAIANAVAPPPQQ